MHEAEEKKRHTLHDAECQASPRLLRNLGHNKAHLVKQLEKIDAKMFCVRGALTRLKDSIKKSLETETTPAPTPMETELSDAFIEQVINEIELAASPLTDDVMDPTSQQL